MQAVSRLLREKLPHLQELIQVLLSKSKVPMKEVQILLGHLNFSNRTVHFWCDNKALVHVINSQSSWSSRVMWLVRCVTQFNFQHSLASRQLLSSLGAVTAPSKADLVTWQ